MSSTRDGGTQALVRAALPLVVREVSSTDPVITLSGTTPDGQAWSLTVWCAWSIDAWGLDWESPGIEDRLWDLIGHAVQSVDVAAGVGPVFGFGEGLGLALDERGDDDPWVLRIPGAVVTGGTNDPDWT